MIASGQTFDKILDIKHNRLISHEDITNIYLTSVKFFRPPVTGLPFFIFVAIVKAWAGVWQALVIYLCILAAVWGFHTVPRITLEVMPTLDDGSYDLRWFSKPSIYFILVGVWVNMFCLFRYYANAVKGSFGSIDQYWSLLLLSPDIMWILILGLVIAKIQMISGRFPKEVFSKVDGWAASMWIATLGFIVYLIAGYLDVETQSIMMACFKPISEIIKHVFHV